MVKTSVSLRLGMTTSTPRRLFSTSPDADGTMRVGNGLALPSHTDDCADAVRNDAKQANPTHSPPIMYIMSFSLGDNVSLKLDTF